MRRIGTMATAMGSVLGLAVLVSLAGAPAARADVVEAEEVIVGEEIIEVPACVDCPDKNAGRVNLSAGIDFTNAYFFRGILQERNGFIWQPYAELDFNLHEGSDPFTNWELAVGIWNSVQSEQTGAQPNHPAQWFELDGYVGLATNIYGELDTSLTYIAYSYPNGAFNTVQELDLALQFDDSEFLGAFSVQPSATFAFELDGSNGLSGREGVYVELDAEPSYTFMQDSDYPVTLSAPLSLGLNISEYYDLAGNSETFGFLSFGVGVGVPLGFVPDNYGEWGVALGVSGYYLNDNLALVNQGDELYPVGTFSVTLDY